MSEYRHTIRHNITFKCRKCIFHPCCLKRHAMALRAERHFDPDPCKRPQIPASCSSLFIAERLELAVHKRMCIWSCPSTGMNQGALESRHPLLTSQEGHPWYLEDTMFRIMAQLHFLPGGQLSRVIPPQSPS